MPKKPRQPHAPDATPRPVRDAAGYCRVSTGAQDNDRQRAEVLAYANAHDYRVVQLVEAVAGSGKRQADRGIDQLRAYAAGEGQGRTIIVSELSRLGRSVSEILGLIDEFTNEHGCRLVFVKENLVIDEGERSIAGVVLYTVFALLAEIEKRLIRERTRDGLAARRAAGVVLGRPRGRSKLDAREADIRHWYELGVTQKAIAKKIPCTQATLSNWLKRKRPAWAAEARQ